MAEAREKLIETAERLYALHGVDAVSIRQVVAEAGQKNVSAVHYHFGSRDGLLETIVALRTEGRNAMRHDMLKALEAEAPDLPQTIRGVARALALPQFQGLARGRPTYSRRFIKQVHQRHEVLNAILSKGYDSGLRACFRMLRAKMPEVPTQVLVHRYIHANAVAIDAAANLEDRIEADPDALDDRRIALHVACCIDSVAAIFAAPVSAETLAIAADPAP
ncbi:TetR family transcriptional regulator [Rhodovulum sp. DZ06]|uniref:TetR family transcriptional regulator n=1 Tax=Rhodovulum sp. DZ06 TaxID=3425126 RepID=UPI003D3495AE